MDINSSKQVCKDTEYVLTIPSADPYGGNDSDNLVAAQTVT